MSAKKEIPVDPTAQNQSSQLSSRNIYVKILVLVLIFAAGYILGHGKWQLGSNFASSNKNLPNSLDYSSVNDAYNILKRDYDGQLSQDQILDGLKEGLAKATGDPYTEYFNKADAQGFNDQLTGSFEGIGAELGKDSSDNIIIVSPLAGFPADKAGLRPKDIIYKINDKPTTGMTINDAVKQIRGPKGTSVKLTIVRGTQSPLEINVTRDTISIPSVTSKIDGNVGYLKISQFGNDTVDLAQKAAADFKAKGVKAVVLDLRNNPGGYLDGAVDVSSLWLNPNQKVVSEKRGSTTIDTKYARGTATLAGLPTVVLINDGSASASEITAGALKDNGAATLLGIKSFGKGSVQQVEQLAGGAEIKVTIARWYTPAGKNIDKAGITPDVVIQLSDDDIKNSRDPQKDKAYEILNQKIGG